MTQRLNDDQFFYATRHPDRPEWYVRVVTLIDKLPAGPVDGEKLLLVKMKPNFQFQARAKHLHTSHGAAERDAIIRCREEAERLREAAESWEKLAEEKERRLEEGR